MEPAHADAVEVELKARVRDVETLRADLGERGAEHVSTATERDTYYAHPARSFAETDEALRIRAVSGTGELTYKGPKQDAATKTRREINVAVDADAMGALLTALGFEAVATVTKRRETFRLEGLTITLDDVEGLGTFAEIEVLAQEGAVDQAREEVLAMATSLGLSERTTTSYLEMLLGQR